MLGVDVSVGTFKDAPRAVTKANRRRLTDAMDKGFAVSQQNAPEDRGTLRQSGYPPMWDRGRIQFGYRANHAKPMEFGTQPFWPPARPLLEWAERVLGDRSAGYAVQRKIAEEGVDAQPYARPGRDAAQEYLRRRNFGRYLDDELD